MLVVPPRGTVAAFYHSPRMVTTWRKGFVCSCRHFTVYENHLTSHVPTTEPGNSIAPSTSERSMDAQLLVCCVALPMHPRPARTARQRSAVPARLRRFVTSASTGLIDGYPPALTVRTTSIVSIAGLTTAGSTMNWILHQFSISSGQKFALIEDMRSPLSSHLASSLPKPA